MPVQAGEDCLDYHALIQDYGYWAILIGTFLEGETILILGGVAAHMGLLDLWLVILAAFCGSSAGDQLYYFIGRWKGPALLDRFPRWKGPAAKAEEHIHRHQNLIILSFRFFYGLRNVTPFMLGICRVAVSRYVPLNLAGAAIWAVAFALLGHVFGEATARLLGHDAAMYLIGGLILIGLGFWAWRRWRAGRSSAQQAAELQHGHDQQ